MYLTTNKEVSNYISLKKVIVVGMIIYNPKLLIPQIRLFRNCSHIINFPFIKEFACELKIVYVVQIKKNCDASNINNHRPI